MFDLAALMVAHPEVIPKIEMRSMTLPKGTKQAEPAASSEQAEPTHTHPPPAPPPADLDPDFFIRSAPFRPPAVRRIQTPEDVQEMVDKLYDTIYDTGRDRGFVRGFAYGTTIAIIITVLLLW
jgi:hypothetical protein